MDRERIFAVALLVVLSVIVVAGTDAAAPPGIADVSWNIRDSHGRNISARADFLAGRGVTTLGSRGLGHDFQLTFPETSPVKSMSFKNLNISSGSLDLWVDEVPGSKVLNKSFKRVFAIDPSSLDFDSAVVTSIAEGSYLYKCADWDFASQTCPPIEKTCTSGSKDTRICTVTGGWKKIKKLTPGEQYSFTLTPADPGFAEYSSDFTSPYCSTGESPCIANSSLLKCRDTVSDGNGPEPNQPNTIDTCDDGTATFSTPSCGGDESVENITITDYNNTYFRAGDTVGVEAWVFCYGTTDDHLGLAYTNDSNAATPQWQLKEFREDGCPAAGYQRIVFNNFTLDDAAGNHSVRAYITYDTAAPPPQNTCAIRSAGNRYDDNDDVVFSVNGSPTPTVMEWGNKTVSCETWTSVDLEKTYTNPIVVVTPEYSSTTNDNGIAVWTRNINATGFEVKASDENFNCQDTLNVHYIVMEEGSWTLPASNIKVEAGKVNTTKYGYVGGFFGCPTYGETVNFTHTFDGPNPIAFTSRGTDNNPGTWGESYVSGVGAQTDEIGTTNMCIGLDRNRAGTGTFTNNETVYWIVVDEGNGTIGGVEYEILWQLNDAGDSGGSWINGYKDGMPFYQSWAHTWTGDPDVIVVGTTSVQGSDGSWPVLYDMGNTSYIRMFVDEANDRSHAGSESGGGWAFDSVGSYAVNAPPTAPTNITCDGGSCNVTVDTFVVLNASGSTDTEGDNITYFIEALLENITTSGDLEAGEKQAVAKSGVIGETGTVSIANFQWTLVPFTNTYNSTPVVIATPVTQNGAAADDDSYIIPTISMVNTTHFNVTICQDNGAATCDPTVASETLDYFVFDVDKANLYSWIDVGTLPVTTAGADTTLTYAKTFANVPVIWTTPQTYSQNTNIAAVVWAEDAAAKSTTTAPLIGCVHQGTGNSCTGGQPSETVGYIAIDISSVGINTFQTGSADIGGSTWTAATFSPTYTNPRVMVTQNDDDGGQDPQYPWARNVVGGGMDFRYCEQDLADDCDSHTGEVVNWFAIEDGNITVGSDDIEAVSGWKNYINVFSSNWTDITELNVTVYVSVYNNSGSTQNGNNNSDLQLEMYNGSDFVEVGNFSVNGVGNFTLTVSDTTVRAGWQTAINTDLRIRGIDFDYNDSLNFDEINWTGLWVTVDGAMWTEIGNHSESATLSWNTTALPDQTCVDLRSRAIDFSGSNSYSSYYTKGACLNISHTTLEIVDITLSNVPIDFGSLDPGVSLQSAQVGSGFPMTVTIESITNVDTNLTLMGTDFTFGAFSFGAGNLSYSNSTSDVKTDMTLAYPAAPPYSNWIGIPGPNGGPAVNRQTYFWISIPPGQKSGTYSSTVTVKAES